MFGLECQGRVSGVGQSALGVCFTLSSHSPQPGDLGLCWPWLTVRRIARCRRRLPRVPTPSQHPPKFNEPDIIALCKWIISPPVWCCAQIIQVRILKEMKKIDLNCRREDGGLSLAGRRQDLCSDFDMDTTVRPSRHRRRP